MGTCCIAQGALLDALWWSRYSWDRGMRQRSKRKETYVHMQLIHFVVQQKEVQHCKGIILPQTCLYHFAFPVTMSKSPHSSTSSTVFDFVCVLDLDHSRRRKWQPTPVFFPGESQGPGSLVGYPSMGSHRVGHNWSDLAAAAAVGV